MSVPAAQFPAGQRSAYQFPVYRWLGWLAVAGFAIGLVAMFFVSGMFGIPAHLGWAAIVILFTFGALLLDKPKLLLNVMLFYFLLVPSNRLFGLLPLPIPGGLNKFFFIPFIALIVMNWIQHRHLKEATLFPLFFCILTGLSWYVNGKHALVGTIQLTIVMLRCYILWYYCRLTCTFESERQMAKWMWGYVAYVAVQFPYNVLWQQGPWPRFHPDRSGGVFGPMSGGEAHMIGYMCVFGLLLVAGWWISVGARARPRRRWLVAAVAAVMAYNLIVMTDTKHILYMLPLIALPFFVHPRIPMRRRISLLLAGAAICVCALAFIRYYVGDVQMRRYADAALDSPRAKMFYAVTVDLPYLVPYPLLGAGPCSFASPQAVEAGTPLARRYIIPYLDENRRRSYYGMQGTVVSASVIGATQSDFFTLMGEYGWAATAVYFGFWFWVIAKLLQKARQAPEGSLPSGLFIGLACCILTQTILLAITAILITPAFTYPLWIFLGRAWDMRIAAASATAEPA